VSTSPTTPVVAEAAAADRIAGLSILKGLVLYGATLTFAGLYAYFMTEIAIASDETPPDLDTAMVSAAAALAGVLGSAFALYIGVPTNAGEVNEGLQTSLQEAKGKAWHSKARFLAATRRILSLEPGGRSSASFPLTFGIWIYALVASAVAVIYLLNRSETPEAIRTLALAFGGYVIAFVTTAYGVATKKG
jgi:hypothetical protein